MAAHADDPSFASALLVRRWRALSIERVLRLDPWRIARLLAALVLRPARSADHHAGIGAILDARPIADILDEVPFDRVARRCDSEESSTATAGCALTCLSTRRGRSVLAACSS